VRGKKGGVFRRKVSSPRRVLSIRKVYKGRKNLEILQILYQEKREAAKDLDTLKKRTLKPGRKTGSPEGTHERENYGGKGYFLKESWYPGLLLLKTLSARMKGYFFGSHSGGRNFSPPKKGGLLSSKKNLWKESI